MRSALARPGVVGFVTRWELPWYAFTVALYVLACATVAFVFPNVSNLWVSIFILASGFTASMGTLVTAIKASATEKEQE